MRERLMRVFRTSTMVLTLLGLIVPDGHAREAPAHAMARAAASEQSTVEFQTSAPNAILMDAESGSVLFEKAADEHFAPANMAKLMTAAIVFERLKAGRLKMDTEFTVTEDAWKRGGVGAGGSSMFAQLNSRMKVSDLLRGLIVQSGNDAAIAIAENIALAENKATTSTAGIAIEDAFAGLMNRRAKEIGLTNSTFRNATGYSAPDQKVTARDMAKLALHIIETYPDYYKIFSEKEFTWNKIRQQNRNPLLTLDIGSDGFTTGYLEESGYALTGSALQNGRRLIVVVSGSKVARDRATEARRLMEWGFRTSPRQVLAASVPPAAPVTIARPRREEPPAEAAPSMFGRVVDYWTRQPTAPLGQEQAATAAELPKPVGAPTLTGTPSPAAISTPNVSAATARAERRVALVIGNSRYTSVPRLDNPSRDTEAVAQSLREVGFTTVQVKKDLGGEALRQVLSAFSAEAASADWAIVYFAGHGVEIGGTNYLVPVDAKLASDRSVGLETVPLDQVLSTVEGARKLRVVILDACRNNPFLTTMSRSVASRSAGRGLARIEPEQSGTVVVYAAKAGQVASDGVAGRANSPFVAALTKHLARPGIEIRKLLGLVRDDVMASTDRQQEPYVSISLGGDDYFFKAP